MNFNWELFDQIEQKQESKDDFIMCCNEPTVIIDSYRTCKTCGRCKEEFIYIVQTKSIRKNKRVLYKRISYFKHLMYLYSCNKLSNSPKYNNVLSVLKNEDFDSIQDLRAIMKKHKFNKFYPSIYLLYRDIKKERLIILTRPQIDKLIHLFVKVERYFQKNNKIRKAMYSYNLLINRMLYHMKYAFYEYVPVPISNLKMVQKIDEILLRININNE
jgi:virulence-associated protein VapD